MEKKKEIGDINNPSFQKGKALGLQALDPLSQEYLSDEIRLNRNEFLQGYAQGLKQFIKENKFILPLMNVDSGKYFEEYLERDFGEGFTQPYFLLGYSNGLKRSSPKTIDNIWREKDKELDENAVLDAWQYHNRRLGYFIGFLVGVYRDYKIAFDQSNVPITQDEYDIFITGLEGKPLNSISNPSLKNTHDQSQINETDRRHKSVHEGGSIIRYLEGFKKPK